MAIASPEIETDERYDVDFDGTSVWVQVEGECVARFGKVAHEVYSATRPRQPVILRGGSALGDWRAFERAVLDVHGFHIPRSATPRRFQVELGIVRTDHSGDYLVPVATLARGHDPFAVDIWGRTPVTRQGVGDAIRRGDLESDHVCMGIRDMQPPGWDMRRIAFLVVYPDEEPIRVEVTDEEGSFGINDGYHRLAAAIYRGDLLIPASLSGYVVGYDAQFEDRIPVEPLTREDAFSL